MTLAGITSRHLEACTRQNDIGRSTISVVAICTLHGAANHLAAGALSGYNLLCQQPAACIKWRMPFAASRLFLRAGAYQCLRLSTPKHRRKPASVSEAATRSATEAIASLWRL